MVEVSGRAAGMVAQVKKSPRVKSGTERESGEWEVGVEVGGSGAEWGAECHWNAECECVSSCSIVYRRRGGVRHRDRKRRAGG
eukprot:scaffold275519_cov30-Tisochrysis_lutea.AAC.1